MEPEVVDADPAILRRLAELGPGPKVLSIYVNLDPTLFPTPKDRQSEITSLLDRAAQRVESLEDHDKKSLRTDVQELRTYFLEERDWAKGVRTLAVFCSGERGLFEILRSRIPVSSRVTVEATPYLEPLTGAMPARGVCVALVDRATARIFSGTETEVEDVTDLHDPVHGRHDQGGWSQPNYQRSTEKSVDDHLKNVGAHLLELHKGGRVDCLVIGSTEELLPRVLDHLHPYLQERFVGRIDADVQTSIPDEFMPRVRELLAREEERREHELFDRLRMELAHGGRAAAGLEDCLAALNESRVETLLVAEGLSEAGVSCVKCGWLGVPTSSTPSPGPGNSLAEAARPRCPLDDSELEQTDNVVERALERTLLLSGRTVVPRFESLAPWGGIAALLRF